MKKRLNNGPELRIEGMWDPALCQAIKNYVGKNKERYMDELPGMLITRCLVRARYRGSDWTEKHRTALLEYFPDMRREDADTYAFLAGKIELHDYLTIPTMGWNRFLRLMEAAKRASAFNLRWFLRQFIPNFDELAVDELRNKLDHFIESKFRDSTNIGRKRVGGDSYGENRGHLSESPGRRRLPGNV